jgi:ribosomal-protein-alanine N-acetyltransferase
MPAETRFLSAEDAGEIAQLHREAFPHRYWSEAEFLSLLQNGAQGLGLSPKQELSAFILYRTVLDEAEILTLVTAEAARKQGHARQLLEQMESTLQAVGIHRIFLEVAVDNIAAISLYHSTGYTQFALRKNYYSRADGAKMDARLMQKLLASATTS